MERVTFPFMDTRCFMMHFNATTNNIDQIVQKLRALPPPLYTLHERGDGTLRIKAVGFCIDVDVPKCMVSVTSTHDRVQEHKSLFKEVFA